MQGVQASREFDDAFTSHIGHVLRNGIRAFVLGASLRLAPAPKNASGDTRHYYRHVSRLSAAFAFLADISMLAMGGALKRKEKISGRLGDVLSMITVSATLNAPRTGRIGKTAAGALACATPSTRPRRSKDHFKSRQGSGTLLRWTLFPAHVTRPPLTSQPRVRASRSNGCSARPASPPSCSRRRRRHRDLEARSSPVAASRSRQSCARLRRRSPTHISPKSEKCSGRNRALRKQVIKSKIPADSVAPPS